MTEALTPKGKLLRRLDEAGGQGLALDRIETPLNIVQSLVRAGQARISFGRLFVVRRPVGREQ